MVCTFAAILANLIETVLLVTTSMNGQLALDALEQADCPFDCIISDVYMPVMDGFGLLKKIREMERYIDSPVISTVELRRHLCSLRWICSDFQCGGYGHGGQVSSFRCR